MKRKFLNSKRKNLALVLLAVLFEIASFQNCTNSKSLSILSQNEPANERTTPSDSEAPIKPSQDYELYEKAFFY